MIVTLFSLFLQETWFADSYREREEILEKNDRIHDLFGKSVQLIKKYEWFSAKAYWDHKWCSIWWGTRAKSCDETITMDEADRRIGDIVDDLVEDVQKNFPDIHIEWQTALVSFAYNCHSWWKDVKKSGLSRHSLWCKKAWNKILPWLVKRRDEESRMIFQKPQ